MKQVVIFTALIAVVLACLPVYAAINVTYTINPGGTQTPISKYIYGTNWNEDADYTINRLGGNRCTAYNWENNWSNAGSDWYFQNDTMFDASNPPVPGKGYTKTIDVTNSYGQASIVTLQLAGYVSAPISGQNLDLSPAPSQYFIPVQFAKGAPFLLSPNTSDNVVYMDEFVNFLVNRYGNASTTNGVKFYSLDNEVDIWHATHKEVHPARPGAQEVKDQGVACATAVKNVDPYAQILGPDLMGFSGFLSIGDDWNSVKGSRPWYISYYLDEMRIASNAAGKRLLDVLDVHWYPEAQDGAGHRILDGSIATPEMYNARMQAPRTLWDTSYVCPNNNTYPNGEESWINQPYWAQYFPILTRFKADIQNYYPGTKISITEYAYGPDAHWSTGIATTDFLGICGKYGVYIANYWGNHNYVDAAIKMYRNYDGDHSTFGDLNIPASMSNKVDSSIYGSVSSANPDFLHLIVLNKNQTDSIAGTFNVAGTTAYTIGRVWAFDNNSTNITERAAISSITNNTFTYTIPKTSVCHIVLRAQSEFTPPAAPTGLTAIRSVINVLLDWNNNTESDLASYNVYRSTTSGTGYIKLNGTLLTASSYFDDSTTSGQTYYYIVKAVDTSWNESGASSEQAVVIPKTALGSVLREWWTGISGGSVSNLTSNANYPNNPTGREQLSTFEGPVDWADGYGTRIRGYIYPPTTGNYTFWIAGDDACQLKLSTDGLPSHAAIIAQTTSWTNSREWTKYSSQRSIAKSLTAGQKYYIEVLHKENTGGDNIAVAWEGPGIAQEVIPGSYLSPWFIGLYGDFDNSGTVAIDDLSEFAAVWLQNDCAGTSRVDLDGDCVVDFYEFSQFAKNWN
jgi:hypothetical protein